MPKTAPTLGAASSVEALNVDAAWDVTGNAGATGDAVVVDDAVADAVADADADVGAAGDADADADD